MPFAKLNFHAFKDAIITKISRENVVLRVEIIPVCETQVSTVDKFKQVVFTCKCWDENTTQIRTQALYKICIPLLLSLLLT